MDRTSLYCSSEHLITFELGQAQLVGSTAFCTLAGTDLTFYLHYVKAPVITAMLLQTVKLDTCFSASIVSFVRSVKIYY